MRPQSMKLRKCSISLLAGLIVSMVAVSTAPAQQSSSRLDEIVTRGALRVGMTGDYKPFSYFDKTTDKFTGFDVDMAEALGKALGVKVEYVHTAWPQLMKDFESDKFDIAMGGVSITLDRQKKGYFSTPIMREGKTPITRCGDAAKYQTLEEIDKPGTRVITNPGGTNEKFARDNFKQAPITVYSDNVTIFDQIAGEKADVMVTDASETLLQQKLHSGVLCSLHPDKPFNFSEKAYWLARDYAFKAFADQWLHIAIESKEYQAITDKWLK